MSASPSTQASVGIEVAPAPQSEKSPYRQNVTSKDLLSGRLRGQNNTEKVAVALGRKIARNAAENSQDLKDTWEGSLASYAMMSGMQKGDAFQGGVVVNYQGVDVVVTHVDPPDEGQPDSPVCLRMGKSSSVIPLDDANAEEAQKAQRYLTTVPEDGRDNAEVQVAQALFEGREVDNQVVTEVAKSLGFITPDVILDVSRGITDKDGKPLINDEDIKTLSGAKRADGEVAPSLSPKAQEIQDILGSDIILSAEQVKAALFVLEIPTDGRQLNELAERYAKELKILRLRREKTTFSSDDAEAGQKIEQMDAREQWLQERIASYGKVSEELKAQTGSEKFDTVQLYYDLVQEGGGDETILADFQNAIREPTVENIAKFDESYETRCKIHRTDEAKKNAKAFAKKFFTYGGVGLTALLGIQIWRAKKKNDEAGGPQ